MTAGDTGNLRIQDIDALGKALLSLSRELWVVKDRLLVLEAALAVRGVIAAQLIDEYQPDAKLRQHLDAERAALINCVLDALQPPDPEPSISRAPDTE